VPEFPTLLKDSRLWAWLRRKSTSDEPQSHAPKPLFSGPLKGQPGKFGFKCLFCGSYRCNRCRNPKLKKVRARIAQIAAEHKLQRMATLTLDRKKYCRPPRLR
jgi:hypothetical protein